MKTERFDARTLAELLPADLVPRVWIAHRIMRTRSSRPGEPALMKAGLRGLLREEVAKALSATASGHFLAVSGRRSSACNNGSAESGMHRGLLVDGDLITADFGLSASNPLPMGAPVESLI